MNIYSSLCWTEPVCWLSVVACCLNGKGLGLVYSLLLSMVRVISEPDPLIFEGLVPRLG